LYRTRSSPWWSSLLRQQAHSSIAQPTAPRRSTPRTLIGGCCRALPALHLPRMPCLFLHDHEVSLRRESRERFVLGEWIDVKSVVRGFRGIARRCRVPARVTRRSPSRGRVERPRKQFSKSNPPSRFITRRDPRRRHDELRAGARRGAPRRSSRPARAGSSTAAASSSPTASRTRLAVRRRPHGVGPDHPCRRPDVEHHPNTRNFRPVGIELESMP